ncbi:MAG: hypothetical protein ACK2U9_22235 [Anaerolineae bacterium]
MVLVMFGFGYTGRLIASSEMQGEVASWEAEVRLEEQRLQESRERLEYVQSDEFVIEKAHTDLGWTFPDEVAVWMVGDDRPQAVATPPEVTAVPSWQLWRQRFFGR